MEREFKHPQIFADLMVFCWGQWFEGRTLAR